MLSLIMSQQNTMLQTLLQELKNTVEKDADAKPSVLSQFLKHVIENKKLISVFLETGVKLDGYVMEHDQQSIKLKYRNTILIIMTKHITTIADKDQADPHKGDYGCMTQNN